MTIGETKLPNKIPNLNQILLSGVKNFEFNNPKIKKIIAIIKDQTLISSFLNKGNNETIKKNRKKTIPKLLLVLVLYLSIYNFNIPNYNFCNWLKINFTHYFLCNLYVSFFIPMKVINKK